MLSIARAHGAGAERSRAFEAAQGEYADGHYADALSVLRRVLDEQPSHVGALELQARAFLAVGQPENAIDAYRGIQRILPWNLPAWEHILGLQNAASDSAGVQATLEELIRLDPTDGYPLLHRALFQVRQRDYEAARKSINAALATARLSDWALFANLDWSRVPTGEWDETTINAFRKMISSEMPKWLPVWQLDARVRELCGQKRYRDALPLARQLVELKIGLLGGENAVVAMGYENLGDLHHQLHQRKEAERYYLEALRLRERYLPQSHASIVMTLEKLAATLQAAGRFHDAEAHYRRVIDLHLAYRDPNIKLPPSLNDYGLTALPGALDGALHDGNQIGLVHTQLRLARLLLHMGRFAESETLAIDVLNRVKAANDVWDYGACSKTVNDILAVQGKVEQLVARLNEEYQRDAGSVAKALRSLAVQTEGIGADAAALLNRKASDLAPEQGARS